MRQERRSKAWWRETTRRWRHSGLTADEFAGAEGINAKTLRWWSSRFGRVTRAEHGLEVVPIEIAVPRTASDARVVEIAQGDSVTVRRRNGRGVRRVARARASRELIAVLALPASVRVYLASEPVDMRRGHDGLFEIVRGWNLDAFSGDLFAFVGKRRDRVKILVWHRGGFVLVYKRLERGRFRISRVKPGETRAVLDATELTMLLDGIDSSCVKRPVLWTPPERSGTSD